MKKLLFIFATVLTMGTFSSVSAYEATVESVSVEEPCSTRYEILYNGQFVGYQTEYNYSLSCSGQATGVIHIMYDPILA